MIVLRSIVMAFACFSVIPMPTIEWDQRNMRFMMAAFPLIGVVIGVAVMLWGLLCQYLGFGPAMLGAGLTLIPIMVSGGIHMDGLADVLDAQSSHASPERKREILKDPHIGAFALIGVCCYLIAYFALACEADAEQLLAISCIPVISRCLSGLATVSLRPSSGKGMYAAESSTAQPGIVHAILAVLFAAASAVMLYGGGIAAVVALVAVVATLLCVAHLASSQYGGMSGDLAGFFLQMAELVMLICLTFVGSVM